VHVNFTLDTGIMLSIQGKKWRGKGVNKMAVKGEQAVNKTEDLTLCRRTTQEGRRARWVNAGSSATQRPAQNGTGCREMGEKDEVISRIYAYHD
jgi:hypothetical protein